MALVRKAGLYQLGRIAWAVAAFGSAIVLYSGNAEPFVSPSQLPGGATPMGMVGWGLGLAAVGWLVVGHLQNRAWRGAGRRAGLTPDGGSLLGASDLSGSVDGRPVQVYTVSRNTGGGGEDGSSSTTFTVVETELSEPAEEGLVVGSGDGQYDDLSSVTVDGVAAVGPEDLARAVLSGRVTGVIQEVDRGDGIAVGDAGGALTDAAPDVSGSFLGGMVESGLESSMPGDASTVTVESEGMLLDADEMRARAEAVAAVADAFEEATADRQPGDGRSATAVEE